ncbi:hypothetical protein ACFSUS_02160 [Spirosoma soli]|uniref:DUF4175 domain-containing protein n=1 Tax=Spirosoma soli TaxID=1770529 RepID=A0ABW5LX95_9BACT
MNELKRLISSVTYQLYANAVLRCVLLAASAYFLTATFTTSPVWPILAGFVGFGLGVWLSRLYQDKKPQAIRVIHQTVGDTEYSLPLLTKSPLNLAEQLQLERLNEQVQNVRIPRVLLSNAGLYGAGLLIALVIHYAYPLLQSNSQTPNQRSFLQAFVAEPAPTAPTFQSAEVRVQPPAYTRLPETNSKNLNVSTIVGSMLSWRLQFSQSQQVAVRLVNSRGQELTFKESGGSFTYQDRLVSSGLYALKAYWHDPKSDRDSLIYQSDFYRLEAKPDLAPKIEPDSKELYRFHYLKDPKTLNVAATFSDDFSVSQAFIVATVARGSGENVKFREVRMPLGQANFKEARLNKTIDLNALNFAPGDELYYYWAAFDNRQPEPNFTKSDTYFVVYKDTTQVEESALATMAVNIMPEYFRSQRQIIIDTEKLIANRKKTPTKTFNSTSNEIGFDQKALRLRYGQFLGEEFETSIGGGHAGPPDDDENPLAGYMHDHDKGEGEHEAEHHKEEHEEHGHGGATNEDKDPLAALMEQYMHSHDNAETNTFHEQSTRSLLKMALEQMWQSELHLRLYEPEKALPYEKKALEYLKLSQQKARSYVKKTGFDPPPIKEKELRLTGELKNVTPTFRQDRVYDQQRIESLVAQALGYLELSKLSTQQRQLMQQLGNALANNLVNSGLQNWSVLASLQKLASGKSVSDQERTQLKTKLYALSGAAERTGTSYVSDQSLQKAFWRHLK